MKYLGSLPFLFMFSFLSAQNPLQHFNLKNGTALQGYDAVSYFEGKPVKGKAEFALQREGITYLFATDAHRKAFEVAPEKYMPQYGGWCAYAMGNSGEKVSVDPETYKVKDGKLYLFYNAFFNNTLNSWNKDETNFMRKADENWRKIWR